MDQEEIEAWYDEQKELLTERYRTGLEKRGNPVRLKKDFLKKLESLHRNYELKSGKEIDSGLKRYFFDARYSRFKSSIISYLTEIKERIWTKR